LLRPSTVATVNPCCRIILDDLRETTAWVVVRNGSRRLGCTSR
jgi:hypothetical protein